MARILCGLVITEELLTVGYVALTDLPSTWVKNTPHSDWPHKLIPMDKRTPDIMITPVWSARTWSPFVAIFFAENVSSTYSNSGIQQLLRHYDCGECNR